MIIGFGNNVVSSLAADITAIQTTIQVMPGAGAMFANLLTSDYANSSNPLKTYAKITLTDAKETVFEVCHLTAVNNDMLTVIRGQEGTTAKGWSLNDVIANFATRGSENQFVQIEQLQSGHYISGVAGGTANALTLELPATYFVNDSTDWTLRTPLIVYPAQNNTGASTLQLTMGGRVLGTFKLYKGNKAELVANDILKDVALVCLLDKSKSFFNVSNPGAIYAGLGTAAFRNVQTNPKDQSSGAVLINGSWGLGGNVIPLANSELLNRSGFPTSLFLQGGGSSDNHFNGYGFGVHGNYGVTSDGTRALSGNLFVDGDGNLSVEWLTINTTDGTIISQKIQKLYGPLNPPPDGKTTQKGIVQLNSSTSSTSTTQAATPSAVKQAYDLAGTKWSAVDATTSRKGIVMLSDNTGVPDSTTAATTTAVNYVLNRATSAYSLAESKYTAGGATTGKAGLVQLVNSMGGSGSLVMSQAAVTTAIQNYPSLGKGQTLQDLRGSRSIDATYTNSTGFPIAVYVRVSGGYSANLYAHVNGIEFGGSGSTASNSSIATAFFIVPNGATYRVMTTGASIALQMWSELR